MKKPAYQITEQKDLPGSEIEILGEIPTSELAPFRQKALENIGQNAKIAGFRPGRIPEKVLVEKFGEQAILEDAASLAIQEIVPEIVEKSAPRYLARPKITITKIVPGNPLGFSVRVAIRPIFTLPDYKKIAAEEIVVTQNQTEREKLVVNDKEIDEVIEQIKNDHAHRELHKHNGPGTEHDNHNHSPAELEKYQPSITDDFVKTLGDFKNIADFRQKIGENLVLEKKQRLLEKRRAKILERLVTETKFPAPQPLIDYELNRMVGQFESDIRQLGLSVDNYLAHIKKTREDLSKEWLPEAEKRARITLILEEIANKENVSASPDTVEQEVRRLKERHADIDVAQATEYVRHILTTEKTITFLETPSLK